MSAPRWPGISDRVCRGAVPETHVKHAFAISRRGAPEVLPSIPSPSSKSEGAGKAGCAIAPAVSCAQICTSRRTRAYRYTDASGFPRATVYGLFRALPGESMLCCHRRLAKMLGAQDLTPAFEASGRHDFAVRACLAKALAGPRTYPASFNEVSSAPFVRAPVDRSRS